MRPSKRPWLSGVLLAAVGALPLSAAESGLIAEFTDSTTSISVLPDFSTVSPDLTQLVADVDQASTSSAWWGLPKSMQNTFLAKMHGEVLIPTAGDWTFYLRSDDGSKLYINGTEVVNNDGLHGMRTRSATVTLPAGAQAIVVEFFENGGGAGLQLDWAGPGVARQRVPASAFQHDPALLPPAPAPAVTAPGLIGRFYDFTTSLSKIPDVSADEPDVVRVETVINEPSDSQAWDGLPSTMADTFAATYTGFITVPAAGNWQFWLRSDDGSKLIIDGYERIDNDGTHGMQTKTAAGFLAAGQHAIQVQFFENGGGAGLSLEWAGPGVSREVVPASAFSHDTGDTGGTLPGDRIGPFRYARKLYDDANPASNDVAADGTVENASLVVGSTVDEGVIETEQWTGTNGAGGRSWAANTFVGDPGRNYFVGMQGWTNVEAINTGIDWIEVSRMQQDAHLRLGYFGKDAADLNVAHGTDFGLDWIVPAPAIVVDFSFRRLQGTGDSIWQKGYYRGNPVQMGVWQVPAGKSLGQAQQDSANRLALLSIMDEITPDSPFLAKLQVQPGGAWQVQLDLDGDGQTDVDVTSATETPYNATALGDIDESSGLLVTASAAGGTSVPKVGKTRIPLAYVESPSETITTPRNRRPIKLATRHASQISPATIEGGSWTAAHTITVTPQVGFSHFSNGKFFAEVPLSAAADTVYTVTQSGSPVTEHTGAIQWLLTNCYENGEITVRKDDKLLLAAHNGYPEGTWTHIDIYGDGLDVREGLDSAVYEVSYPNLGTYTARSFIDNNDNDVFDAGDTQTGSYVVHVVEYNLPEYIASEIGFTRDLYVKKDKSAGDATLVQTAADQNLDLTEVDDSGDLIYLTITANEGNEPVIEARVGTPDGPLLDAQEVATFSIRELTASIMPIEETFPDGSFRLKGVLEMDPIRMGLEVRLQVFVSGASFEDGGLNTAIHTDEFDMEENSMKGTSTFFMIHSKDAAAGPCHNRKVFQLGTQVGN